MSNPKRKPKKHLKNSALYGVLSISAVLAIILAVILLTHIGKKNEETNNMTDSTTEGISTATEPPTTTEAVVPDVNVFGTAYPHDTQILTISPADIEGLEHDMILSGIQHALSLLTELERVNLYDAELTLDEMHTLHEGYPDVSFGWNIDIYGVSISSDDEKADISGIEITDMDDFKKRLSILDRLTYLDMCDCGLTNEQMEELINEFPLVKFVWKVTLGLWTIRTDTVAFSTLKDGTITYRLTNDDCKVLKYCTDMVALDLGHNKVTDLSFLQYMPELKILILVDNWLTDTQSPYLYDLSMLKYCPKLMYLEFFVGDVTDISVFDYLPNLVDLNISYNPISDVSHLLNFTKLERLYIEHTGLTEQDYQLLKETYPDAYIVYYGEGSVDQGWREHERYFAMIDMFHNNYVHDLFKD